MAAKANRFTSRDLITIGVFNALILVIYTILAAILNSIPVVNFFFGGIAAAVLAPIYLLMVTKVRKRGVFLLSACIFSLLMLFLGLWLAVPIILLGALLADGLAGNRDYRDLLRLTLAYLIFKLAEMGGFVLLFTVGADRYADRLDGAAREQFVQGMQLMTWWLWAILLGLTGLGAIAGGFLAKGLFRKHLEKAGVLGMSS